MCLALTSLSGAHSCVNHLAVSPFLEEEVDGVERTPLSTRLQRSAAAACMDASSRREAHTTWQLPEEMPAASLYGMSQSVLVAQLPFAEAECTNTMLRSD